MQKKNHCFVDLPIAVSTEKQIMEKKKEKRTESIQSKGEAQDANKMWSSQKNYIPGTLFM